MKEKSKRAHYLPKRRADASRPAAEMSQWDVMLAIYPYDRSVLAAGLCGQRSVPLEGLLLGCPPALGSPVLDWTLFAQELQADYGVLVDPAITGGHFAAVGASVTAANLDALQHVVGRHVVPPLDDRIDYHLALLGDLDAAHELRARHIGRNALVTAALDGLILHCKTAGSRPIVWRAGLGMEVFLSSVWSAQGDLVDAAKAASILVDWSSAHRERDRDAGVEAGRQAADDRALGAVDDADEWLSDRRSPLERAQAEQAERRRAEEEAKAGKRLVETAFQTWRRLRLIGMEVPEDLQRKAADDLLTEAELIEDRKIPVDVDIPSEARRICEEAAARLDDDVAQAIAEQEANPDPARDAAHDEARRNLARMSKSEPSKEDLKGLETADMPARLAALSRILARPSLTDAEAQFAVEVAFEDDEVLGSVARGDMGAEMQRQILDRGGVELLEALNRRTVAIERSAEEAREKEVGAKALQANLEAKKAAMARTMKVVGPIKGKAAGMGDNDMAKLFEVVADAMLPLRVADEVAMSREDLVREWPHAVDVVDRILSEVREGEVVRLRPTLLVGGPGTGKTTLVKALACLLGLPTVVFPCASVADGSFGGTPMQWASRRPSVPLEAVRQHECANPAVILDELEKVGQNERNGNLLHALLPMLETHSAKAYFEPGLEQSVDLSAVVYLATANSLEGVPQPLLDRFRVLRMPDPEPRHIGDLAKTIVDDIVGERRLDRRWVPDLAPDELDVVRRAWGGGSLRRLRRAVEATLEAREAVLRGRAM